MIRKALYKITKYLPCRLITRDGTPYLERYFLWQLFGLTFYLHRFVGADGDREVHNHPWDSVAVCLAGGYLEERLTAICILQGWVCKVRRIFPGFVNRIRANDFHRIRSTHPETWTLFIHGQMKIGWGFLRYEQNDSLINGSQVVFHQPYELTNGTKWWLDAPKGHHASREIYNPKEFTWTR